MDVSFPPPPDADPPDVRLPPLAPPLDEVPPEETVPPPLWAPPVCTEESSPGSKVLLEEQAAKKRPPSSAPARADFAENVVIGAQFLRVAREGLAPQWRRFLNELFQAPIEPQGVDGGGKDRTSAKKASASGLYKLLALAIFSREGKFRAPAPFKITLWISRSSRSREGAGGPAMAPEGRGGGTGDVEGPGGQGRPES